MRFRRALACLSLLLLGTPAAAQSPMPLRDRLVIVHATGMAPITTMLSRGFTERYDGVGEPTRRALPTALVMEMFCAGIGPQTPDIAVVGRRMPRPVLEMCQANGVRDVIEIELGRSAVVLVARRGEATPALTSRQVWEALAAERPVNDEFVPNRVARWSDVAPGLPAQEIRVVMPSRGHGVRSLFEDMVLETGCRNVRDIRLLFEANYRRNKCVTLREDGRVRSVDASNITPELLAAPPGTIGLMSYDQLLASGGNLVAISIDGVVPTQQTIFGEDYGAIRTVYLYAKREHTRTNQGIGVVRGIREFLDEATTEQSFGPGGYLAVTGLVPLGPAERAAQRRIAERLTTTSR
jgi:phosphate transport system substrate-binding protein